MRLNGLCVPANVSFLLPRLEPLRCRKVSVSLIAVSLLRIGGPAIVVGRDKIGVEPDRFAKVADRLGVLTLFPIGDSAIEVGRDKIWVESDRLSVIADGLLVVARVIVRKSSIEVGKRIIGSSRITLVKSPIALSYSFLLREANPLSK